MQPFTSRDEINLIALNEGLSTFLSHGTHKLIAKICSTPKNVIFFADLTKKK